jgi:hypothetical protein
MKGGREEAKRAINYKVYDCVQFIHWCIHRHIPVLFVIHEALVAHSFCVFACKILRNVCVMEMQMLATILRIRAMQMIGCPSP